MYVYGNMSHMEVCVYGNEPDECGYNMSHVRDVLKVCNSMDHLGDICLW